MRMSRSRHRTRQAPAHRTLARLLIPIAVLAVAATAPAVPATYARLSAIGPGAASSHIRALSSNGALQLSSRRLDLATVTAGESATGVLQVRNTSPRSLPLTVTVTGAPGFKATVSPSLLPPGQTARIEVSGTAEQAGDITGQVQVSAFAGGFLSLSVPITAVITAPAPAPPPTPETAAAPAPETAAAPAPAKVSNEKRKLALSPVIAPKPAKGAVIKPAPLRRKNG